jgi:hypothetical protein
MSGYTEQTAMSLLDCFEVDCVAVADQSAFDQFTGTVTTQFTNTDDFLDCMENKLGSDDDNISVEKSKGGTPCPTSTFELSKNSKAFFAFALDDPDMDLAANLHASTKSCWTNFSISTGNSTNRLVNTKQFALTHKACALALTNEQKKSADMEHKHMALSSCIQELEEMLAHGGPFFEESPPPASAPGARARISFQDKMAVDPLSTLQLRNFMIPLSMME